ncbi:hypothetical protein [Flavobacterium sp.]|nr:hypothetical protein [Flavobacterium sp.]
MRSIKIPEKELVRKRSQPRWLGEGATAEKIKGGRHDTAGMQWNAACGV